jgi:hypothetical protein
MWLLPAPALLLLLLLLLVPLLLLLLVVVLLLPKLLVLLLHSLCKGCAQNTRCYTRNLRSRLLGFAKLLQLLPAGPRHCCA